MDVIPLEKVSPFMITGIGSMPQRNPQRVCEAILKYMEECPFWPQLPKRSKKEDMITQFGLRIPCLSLEEDEIVLDRTCEKETALTDFYEELLGNKVEALLPHEDEAAGLYEFIRQVSDSKDKYPYLKGQVVGPITLGISVKDREGNTLITDLELFEASIYALSSLAAWQLKRFQNLGARPIVFLDEPGLSGMGSGFFPVNVERLKEIIETTIFHIRSLTKELSPSPLIGIHCCGDSDWPLLLKLPIDILSMDAFEYIDHFILYHREIKEFLERGGIIAWGLVPTNEIKEEESPPILWAHLKKRLDYLKENGILAQDIANHSMLTPACGLGLTTEERALKVLNYLQEICKIARREYGIEE